MQKPVIKGIVAVSNNLAIGQENQLPWRIPNDLKLFKALTRNCSLIMGWKTWVSLPGILPNRKHYVVCKNHTVDSIRYKGVVICRSICEAMKMTSENGSIVFIIGGGEIFRQTLHLIDVLYMTRVNTWVKNPGATFPNDWGKHFDHEHVIHQNIPDPIYDCDQLIYYKKTSHS